MSFHTAASIIQIAACIAICLTCSIGMYAIWHDNWKYLPTHLSLIVVQACIVGAMVYLRGGVA